LAAAAIVSAALAGCSTPSPAEDLAGKVEASDLGTAYGFEYEALGAPLLDCTSPNRRFTVESDRRGVVVADADGRVLAFTDGDRRLVSRRAFAPGTADAPWVAVAEDDPIDDSLGPDLASYLRGPQPPATPWETIRAALKDSDVERATARDGSGQTVFTIELPATGTESGPIRLSATFERSGSLDSLSISQTTVDGGERTLSGWRITLGGTATPARPAGTETVRYEELLEPVEGAGTARGCRLGGGL
jgi:hypothetical protein